MFILGVLLGRNINPTFRVGEFIHRSHGFGGPEAQDSKPSDFNIEGVGWVAEFRVLGCLGVLGGYLGFGVLGFGGGVWGFRDVNSIFKHTQKAQKPMNPTSPET